MTLLRARYKYNNIPHRFRPSIYSKLKYVECTKCVRVQAWIRVCELSVYVVCVRGLFIQLIVVIMAMCCLQSYQASARTGARVIQNLHTPASGWSVIGYKWWHHAPAQLTIGSRLCGETRVPRLAVHFTALGSGVEALPRWEADDGGASGPPGASTIENALLTSEWTDLVQLLVCTNTTAQSTVSLKDNGKDWEEKVLTANLWGKTAEF